MAVNVSEGLIGLVLNVEGANLSPHELQGKYAVALKKIAGETAAADRHKPIFQRNGPMDERQAVKQAANALAALWKIRGAEKT